MQNNPKIYTGTAATDQEKAGPRVVEQFYNGSGSEIADGAAVAIDTSVTTYGLGNAIKASATLNDAGVVGVADEAIANLEWGKVVVYGVKEDAKVATGVLAGQLLGCSSTSGVLVNTTATNRGVAYALANEASNLADIFVRLG